MGWIGSGIIGGIDLPASGNCRRIGYIRLDVRRDVHGQGYGRIIRIGRQNIAARTR